MSDDLIFEGDDDEQEDAQTSDSPSTSITGLAVELVGHDGNAFSILGRVRQAMRRAHVDPAIIEAYTKEATAGDYNHLLAVTMKYVDVR